MKADLTRRSFIPERHYSRTVQQQGRVPLDADANEQLEIDAHRLHTETIDVVGRTGTPKGDGFLVEPTPSGTDLRVRAGRYYVDGLLCEAEGAGVPVTAIASATQLTLAQLVVDGAPLAPSQWVEVWSAPGDGKLFQVASIDAANRAVTLTPGSDVKTPFTDKSARLRHAWSYGVQPDWPTPANAKGSPVAVKLDENGLYLLYLDVWERHVTALEDPHLAETALGGADTCTRLKTVWQLKLTQAGSAGDTTVTCDSALPDPSAGRGALSARARKAAGDAGPCVVAPTSQYRSLENQLYRVEIHDGGDFPADPVTFKYSRDNGSVVAAWVQPSVAGPSNQVTVSEPGKDKVVGFAAGQWIELVDDVDELGGNPGQLVKIQKVDGNTLTVSAAVDWSAFSGTPRVRRWDHVSTTAAIPVSRPTTNDGFIPLEYGIEIRFEDGTYDSGDHWTIPARAATGDIEWPRDLDGVTPLVRAREGVVHHVAPLAIVLWDGSKFSVQSDCRTQFPPLNHICADDVCLHDDPCGKGAKTVQDAIKELCQERDLAWHNQHLHGWGVVCGMQVNCMTTGLAAKKQLGDAWGEYVWLHNGYAIDPTGQDIRVEDKNDETVLALAQMIEQAGIATRGQDGKLADCNVSLWIDTQAKVHVEPYDPKAKFDVEKLLDGTLIMDFYKECLKPLVDFFRGITDTTSSSSSSSSSSSAGAQPVDLISVNAKRLIALLNLIMQLQPQNGSFIYLSGETDPATEGENKEDALLRATFAALVALLQSDTFCGMFADVKYPDYNVYGDVPAAAPHPTTLFGSDRHTRLRLTPNGKFAFTCGAGANINVYDLGTDRMVQRVTFPAPNAMVTDVAFDATSSIVYAIASIGGASADTMFVIGTLAADGSVSWNLDSRVNCNQMFVTLATSKQQKFANKVWAVAPGQGLYVFNTVALTSPPTAVSTIGTTSHLAVSDRADGSCYLYVGVDGSGANGHAAYDQVVSFDAASGAQRALFRLPDGMLGADDLCVGVDANNTTQQLFCVLEPRGGKNVGLCIFDDKPGQTPTTPVAAKATPFFPDAVSQHAHFAFNPQTSMLFTALEDSYQGLNWDASRNVLSTSRHPLQIAPVSVAINGAGTFWYVLNWGSNTITKIPAVYVGPNNQPLLPPDRSVIDVNKLAQYRADALTAFVRVLGRFLQYLKDCFCDHLLVHCPDPTGKKVYLADVAFKGGAVWQICNFSVRRYVHTFPTVEYWMSLVPVLPFVKKWVADFCCMELHGIFDRFTAPKSTLLDAVRPSLGRVGVTKLQAYNFRGAIGAQASKLFSVGSTSTSVVGNSLKREPGSFRIAPSASLGAHEILSRNAADASGAAAAKGVQIAAVNKISSGDAARVLARTALAPSSFAAGQKLDLYTDDAGNVIAFEPHVDDSPAVAELRQEVTAQKAAVDAASQAAGQVPALSKNVSDLQTQLQQRDDQVKALSGQLTQLQTAYAARANDVATLTKQISDLTAKHAELSKQLTTVISRLPPVRPQ